MQQITLSLISGKVTVETVPAPLVRKGAILIKGHCSLVSAGTEKMLVTFGKAGWIDKARLHPDKAGRIWLRIGKEGFLPVIRALLRKLRQPLPLGYCHAGEVIAIGEGVKGFRVGDRVVSNGPHAEIVCVSQNLVAAVPPGVSCGAAAFAVPGAIALQGIRLLQPALGETVVVIGLGLIGNLAADLLKINGCRVVCADTDPQRVEMAIARGHAACGLPGDGLIRMTARLTNGLVVIATPHHLHGVQVLEALKAGKHVFVEKPVAIFESELAAISAYLNSGDYLSLTVGFNRRFSPFALKMKALLIKDAPVNIVAVMNAGHVPPDSWLHDRERGGGRLLGEACHLVDLVIWLTGSRVTAVCAHFFGVSPTESTDSATVLLRFANGSTGTIHYFANGNERYQKERIEVHVAGRTLIMDDFVQLKGYGYKGFVQMRSRQDKGHRTQFRKLTDYIRNGGEPLMRP